MPCWSDNRQRVSLGTLSHIITADQRKTRRGRHMNLAFKEKQISTPAVYLGGGSRSDRQQPRGHAQPCPKRQSLWFVSCARTLPLTLVLNTAGVERESSTLLLSALEHLLHQKRTHVRHRPHLRAANINYFLLLRGLCCSEFGPSLRFFGLLENVSSRKSEIASLRYRASVRKFKNYRLTKKSILCRNCLVGSSY